MALDGVTGSRGTGKSSKSLRGSRNKENKNNEKPVFDKKATGAKGGGEEAWLKSLISTLEKKSDKLDKKDNESLLKDLKKIKKDIDKGEKPKDEDLLKATKDTVKSTKKPAAKGNGQLFVKPKTSFPSSMYGPVRNVPRGKISSNFFPGLPSIVKPTSTDSSSDISPDMGAITGVPIGKLPDGLAPGVPK